MINEELKKKAEEYQTGRKDLNYFSEPYKDKIRKAYIAGAKAMQQENEQLKNTIMQLRKQIDKMKNCSNCNGIIKGGLRTERCKICIKDTTFGYWEFAE